MMAIESKVIRKDGRHITVADYGNVAPLLGSKNVEFPKIGTLAATALRRLLPPGRTINHRVFDDESKSYRLGSSIGELRDKGWPVVNHDYAEHIGGVAPRTAKRTAYELYADFDKELGERIRQFCNAVDRFESAGGGEPPAP
jgi:hypothetical protein